ncbi:hypothetical protein ACFL4G_09855, partial [Thermodesulfobacteriota bacterium]
SRIARTMIHPDKVKRHRRWLLINPPNRQRVVRDCYCSDIVKAGYYWHPMDLLVQAALLVPHAEVVVLDAIASGMSSDRCLEAAERAAPDGVLCLVGNIVHDDDLLFCRSLHQRLPNTLLVGSGDLFQEDPVRALSHFPPFDAALLDFTSQEIVRLAQGTPPGHDMVFREKGSVEQAPLSRARRFSYPPPPDGLFKTGPYRLPFYGGAPFYSILASYGCPRGSRKLSDSLMIGHKRDGGRKRRIFFLAFIR